jgi:enoyl-CoA hydratase
MEIVRSQRENGVAVLTLADASRRNAISSRMAGELAASLDDVEADATVRAVIITGQGSSFCAGADRAALRRADEAVLREIYGAFLKVLHLPIATVAAVNGPAVGAGFNLALACDVRIVGESAVFDSRFVTIPIHPGGGHTWMLTRSTNPQVAAAMALFGQPVDSSDAVRLGLAWCRVPDADLLDVAKEMCAKLPTAPADLVRQIKQTLRTAPSFEHHDEASEYELHRQLASIARPEYGAQFRVGR